jgi:hypothetical protein
MQKPAGRVLEPLALSFGGYVGRSAFPGQSELTALLAKRVCCIDLASSRERKSDRYPICANGGVVARVFVLIFGG